MLLHVPEDSLLVVPVFVPTSAPTFYTVARVQLLHALVSLQHAAMEPVQIYHLARLAAEAALLLHARG